jgi:protein gp37
MGATTKIEWADKTFNPFEGCAKVSPGCKHCYAEAGHKHKYSSLKEGGNPGTCWGINAPRLARSEAYWKEPAKWDREAQRDGRRFRVFCASMGDVFEVQSPLSKLFAGTAGTVPTGKDKTRQVTFVDLDEQRLRLLELIRQTPHLDWLLLTKRPEAIIGALERAQLAAELAGNHELSTWLVDWVTGEQPPLNVWLGTSAENQAEADKRLQWLLMTPATKHFVSYEPALGPIDFTRVRVSDEIFRMRNGLTDELLPEATHTYSSCFDGPECLFPYSLDWIICGGESGPQAVPMHPKWAQDVRDQCQAAQVAFMFKQWGQWAPTARVYELYPRAMPARLGIKFQDMEPGRKFDYPGQHPDYTMWKFKNKHEAGRMLDGREWDEVPPPEL